MTPLVSIVIVNWHAKDYIRDLLAGLARQTHRPLEIWLVNQTDAEDLQEFALKTSDYQVRVIDLPENAGFAAANNAGIRKATGDYILLLNPDTRVEPDTVAQLLAGVARTGADFVCPKLLDAALPAIFDRISDGYARSGLALTIGKGARDEGQYDADEEVFGAPGAAVLFRRQFFDAVGLFDEGLFLYYEDVDLNLRARLLGLRCFYIPAAVVYHHGSATTGSRFNRTTVYYSTRNLIWLYRARLPAALRHPLRHGWMLLRLAGFHLLRTGQIAAYVRGLLDGYRGAPPLQETPTDASPAAYRAFLRWQLRSEEADRQARRYRGSA
jgi:GT2 family glycosyltransferase